MYKAYTTQLRSVYFVQMKNLNGYVMYVHVFTHQNFNVHNKENMCMSIASGGSFIVATVSCIYDLYLYLYMFLKQVSVQKTYTQSTTSLILSQVIIIMQKSKSTLLNLHKFQDQIFLGFASEEPTQIKQYDFSFVCGKPLWLKKPTQKLIKCDVCHSQNLTFLCQIFCPLDADHCYNRILYILFCEKCRRCFKCIKQQTTSSWQPTQQLINIKSDVKILTQKGYQIQTNFQKNPYDKKQFLKVLNKSKLQVQQQAIIEQEDDSQDEEQEQVDIQKINEQNFKNNKFVENMQKQKKEQYEQIQKEVQDLTINPKIDMKEYKENNIQEKQKKDYVFQQYKKTMKVLQNPIMLYSNVPVPYNSLPLNPKHFCKGCNSKLSMEVQLTEQLLLINKNLVILDWGSLMIYTCTASCQNSQQECVVVQYELDAISQQEVNTFKKKKKNKKKNSSKSRQKKQQQNIQQKNEPTKKQTTNLQLKGKQVQINKNEDEGDWD